MIDAAITIVAVAILVAAIIAVGRRVISDARLRPGGDPDTPTPCHDPGAPLRPAEQLAFARAVRAYYGIGGDL